MTSAIAHIPKFKYLILYGERYEWGDITELSHPLPAGTIIVSPLSTYHYTIIAPVCCLFDREVLEWPYCWIQWRCKGAYWNRVGKRFVLDRAGKFKPSYAVKDQYGNDKVLTMYWIDLPTETWRWWNANR
jgi:hypothetical protein